MKKRNVRMMVTLGMLVAVEIVLSRFLSINTWRFKIGFSFVPIVLAAMLYAGIRSGSGWIPDGAVYLAAPVPSERAHEYQWC